MSKSLIKYIYFNVILKKLYYKFFFLFFLENPLISQLKVNINTKENLYLYFYFLEMLFYKKPTIEKGKMSYNKLGHKSYSSTVLLSIYDLYYILNFLKTIFLSLKGFKLKNNFLILLDNNVISLNYILNSSLFSLYKDSLTSIMSIIPILISLKNSKKFLNYYLLRLLGLV